MSRIKQNLASLPQNPGVYFFHDLKGKILYIGKATNLRSRVSSYFRGVEGGEGVAGRSEWISSMIFQVEDIKFEETESVLEALILESNLIKKHQPKYNTLEKDDKSFSYFVITKDEFPRVLIVRKTDLDVVEHETQSVERKNVKNKKASRYAFVAARTFGPYTSKLQMQIALKIIRGIFPFHAMKQQSEKGCLDFQLGKCPGPYAGAISKEDYKKNIRGIRMILEGKKKRLVKTLEKEMQVFAKAEEFEKAAAVRNKIHALAHIRDVALLTRDFEEFSLQPNSHNLQPTRIEAYDISNISGTDAVGSMVVFENGKPSKGQYRKFKIKTIVGADDVGSMQEILQRRFGNDWAMPDLILLDGGAGHLNMAEKLLHQDMGLAVPLVGVAKGPTRRKLDLRRDKNLQEKPNAIIENILANDNLVKAIMDEAHRYAITFHRKLRSKNALK